MARALSVLLAAAILALAGAAQAAPANAPRTTTTNASSTFAFKIPMSTADIGKLTIQAFYDGALKYGADDVSCIVPVR